MLDWHRAVDELNRLGNVVREVHIVSVRNECKELLLVLQRTKDETDDKTATEKALQVFCVNDNNIVSYSLDEALSVSQRLLSAAPKAGQYLYEPNASFDESRLFCFASLSVIHFQHSVLILIFLSLMRLLMIFQVVSLR